MDQEWIAEELRLWNLMMDPSRGRKRLTVHSMVPGPERDKLLGRIEKQREKDFATGWRTYDDWIRH